MQQRLPHIAALSLLSILCLLIASGFGMRVVASVAAQTAAAQAPAPATSAATYVLGSTDRIRLKVYGEPDISGEYEIDPGGNVSVPLAGHIKAAGSTTRQLEKSITSALSKGIV